MYIVSKELRQELAVMKCEDLQTGCKISQHYLAQK